MKTLLIINTATSILWGIGFLFAPAMTTATYDVALGEDGKAMTRFLGAAWLGLVPLTGLAARSENSEVRKLAVYAQSVGLSLGFAVSLYNQLGGVGNALGWSNVVIFALLAIGYLYFAIFDPDKI